MNLSPGGASLIEAYEGFSARPYRDSVGVWTIGYGSTRGVGPSSPHVTREQAGARLRREVDSEYGAAINALHLPLNQNQYDALVSFVYNCGVGGVASSTGVGRALRRHDWTGAANALLAWDKAGGRALLGLTRRRHAERALFLKAAGHNDAFYLTTWERQTVQALHDQRLIARHHGGWAKIDGSHLRIAARAKHDLLARIGVLRQQDANAKHRRERVNAMRAALG